MITAGELFRYTALLKHTNSHMSCVDGKNVYFDLASPKALETVDDLFSLNIEKHYYHPGSTEQVGDPTDPLAPIPHKTSGMFRGQIRNWPLLPKSFRDIKWWNEDTDELSDAVLGLRYNRANSDFKNFCERAELQNPQFPSSVTHRMCIAQHFGIDTPLLDWSKNILTAVYFAIRNVLTDESWIDDFEEREAEEDPGVFIYHITDERLLHDSIPQEGRLSSFGQSALVQPPHIDRRIERQKGVFSYHPHPSLKPTKIPIKVYTVEWNLIQKLLRMMEGFGFTGDYFFPDYAGIAQSVKSGISL